jgi:hypothetical protein
MKLSIPTSWDDVTVLEYQQIASLESDSTPLKRLKDVISIFCNIDANTLDMASVREIEKSLSFLNTKMLKGRFTEFKHEGVSYKWIKSLNEITLGEQISIEQTIDLEGLNFYQSFDLIMAVLLQKENETFEAERINELREVYGSFPITKVHEMIIFFLSGGVLSLKDMLMFSVVPRAKRQADGQVKKKSLTKRLLSKAFRTVLNGWQWLIDLQKTILQNMIKYSK